MEDIGWQDIVTALSIFFGLITLVAYLEQRRNSKAQNYYLEYVKRNVDKDISQEEIQQLEQQRTSMQMQVADEVPRLARKAVLLEQHQIQKQAVVKHFEELKRIENELETNDPTNNIDPLIEKEILDRLLPSFQVSRRIQHIQIRILLSAFLIITSGVFIHGFIEYWFDRGIAVYAGIQIFQYFLIASESEKQNFTLQLIGRIGYIAICLGLMIIGLFLFWEYKDYSWISWPELLVFILIALFGTSGLLMYKTFNRWLIATSELNLAHRISQ